MTDRLVPDVPPAGKQLRLLIDTDFANEIDDLYAVAMAIASPDRFRIEGLVATHFAHAAGRGSLEQSFNLLQEFVGVADCADLPVLRGGDPLRYADDVAESEGADFIIERAGQADESDPLWIVGLGAASNIASAINKAPEIKPRVRLLYHARSEWSWPQRTEQFNVHGDREAARTLLTAGAPLVWFDTGTALTCPMETTAERLAGCGPLGTFLHEFRHRKPYFQREDKGFFDLGDIAWLIDPSVCESEIVDAPNLAWNFRFTATDANGKMLRVFNIKPEPTWEMFFGRMAQR